MITMKRDFNTLDPSSLKAFHYSALSLNFTKAASLAGLTQSGSIEASES